MNLVDASVGQKVAGSQARGVNPAPAHTGLRPGLSIIGPESAMGRRGGGESWESG